MCVCKTLHHHYHPALLHNIWVETKWKCGEEERNGEHVMLFGKMHGREWKGKWWKGEETGESGETTENE